MYPSPLHSKLSFYELRPQNIRKFWSTPTATYKSQLWLLEPIHLKFGCDCGWKSLSCRYLNGNMELQITKLLPRVRPGSRRSVDGTPLELSVPHLCLLIWSTSGLLQLPPSLNSKSLPENHFPLPSLSDDALISFYGEINFHAQCDIKCNAILGRAFYL